MQIRKWINRKKSGLAAKRQILPQSRYNGGVSIQIRSFRKADFETLWRIDQACFDPQLAYSQPEMAFYMRRPGAFSLVAEAPPNGEPRTPTTPDHRVPSPSNLRDPNAAPVSGILGFIVAEVRRRNGHIITIDVVAAARRSGVGSALLRAAEERLRESGATTVALETAVNNAAAIRFYKQKGYFVERTARGYYSNHLDALVMAKSLVANA